MASQNPEQTTTKALEFAYAQYDRLLDIATNPENSAYSASHTLEVEQQITSVIKQIHDLEWALADWQQADSNSSK